MNTLLLDLNNWDLLTDATGDIAMASEPYALAQDVASAIKTFLGEVWYNRTLGIPYFDEVLGHAPPMSLLKEYLVNAALTVPGVVSAQCVISSYSNRVVTGQVQFLDTTGATHHVSF